MRIDIFGPALHSDAENTYTVAILGSYSTKSDVFIMRANFEFACTLRNYRAQMQNYVQDRGYKLF